ILAKHKPDAIISTRPVGPMEAMLLNAARRLNITRIMYILSWDNITAKGVFPETADYYLTWGPIMNNELKEYYKVTDDRLFLTGVTHFDVHHQTKQNPNVGFWLNKLKLDEKKPYLFFTMSASYYAPNEIEIIEWLAQKVERNAYGADMQLVIRPHMANLMEGKSDLNWKDRLKAIESSRVAIDFPDVDNTLLTWYMKDQDMVKLSNLLEGATICFNSGSTVAIEAVMLDKPTVLTFFDTEKWPEWRSVQRMLEYVHIKKFLATGATRVVKSFDEMDNAIQTYLRDPKTDAPQRKIAVEQECYAADGKATERFVQHVTHIIKELKNK
ncbi:MAG: hypothetical protein EOP49_28455, partial [Sphingobacteriales bacterium]